MTTLIMSDGSFEHYDNKNITPPTSCLRCQHTALEHAFTAGHMSDQYSSSVCERCGFVAVYVLGSWCYMLYTRHSLTVNWFTGRAAQILLSGGKAEFPIWIEKANDDGKHVYVRELPFDCALSTITRLYKEGALET